MNEQMRNSSNCSNPFKLSRAQESFVQSGNYQIFSQNGLAFNRSVKTIGLDPRSGDILVKETNSTGRENYQKVYIVKPSGESEDYKGQPFLRI